MWFVMLIVGLILGGLAATLVGLYQENTPWSRETALKEIFGFVMAPAYLVMPGTRSDFLLDAVDRLKRHLRDG